MNTCETENVKNDVSVEPLEMVKNSIKDKGFDSCVDCQNCKNNYKNSATDENYADNYDQYDADSPVPSSLMPQDPRPGPLSSSRLTSPSTAPVATASGSPGSSSCLTPEPSSEATASTSEVFHSAKHDKHP